MAKYIYYRCSTEMQDFLQEQECVLQYLNRAGVALQDIAETLQEKISGTKAHTERGLSAFIDRMQEGDTLYFSELSRLGRNMADLYGIVAKCCGKRIDLVQCKDGQRIENESIGGKALLFALSLVAEIEVQNIQQRTRMGLAAKKAQIEKEGYFVSNSGNVCTHLGNGKGCDTSAATIASNAAARHRKEEWKRNSSGYQWAMGQVMAGRKTRQEIIDEFNGKGYTTREGGRLTAPILSRWAKELKIIKD